MAAVRSLHGLLEVMDALSPKSSFERSVTRVYLGGVTRVLEFAMPSGPTIPERGTCGRVDALLPFAAAPDCTTC